MSWHVNVKIIDYSNLKPILSSFIFDAISVTKELALDFLSPLEVDETLGADDEGEAGDDVEGGHRQEDFIESMASLHGKKK